MKGLQVLKLDDACSRHDAILVRHLSPVVVVCDDKDAVSSQKVTI